MAIGPDASYSDAAPKGVMDFLSSNSCFGPKEKGACIAFDLAWRRCPGLVRPCARRRSTSNLAAFVEMNTPTRSIGFEGLRIQEEIRSAWETGFILFRRKPASLCPFRTRRCRDSDQRGPQGSCSPRLTLSTAMTLIASALVVSLYLDACRCRSWRIVSMPGRAIPWVCSRVSAGAAQR